eukprot:CAMPEP_0119144574 /NCGR_PEP_ID=MMETSP1310-20130426/36083_1 /TAXON_ID=464262 /ORGANISM="Genus nov. species nov., Strain RCC2339" /LENGTH=31 /DNA_ID= /DNA_START= /DNA_END= /DNA_ORIENTATION=
MPDIRFSLFLDRPFSFPDFFFPDGDAVTSSA